MNIPNLKYSCEQAKIYYYDILFHNEAGVIPANIIGHIKQCEICQKQIDKLKAALNQTKPVETSISNTLKDHFGYVNQKVTCKDVRPFLPALLDATSEITIPTPITAHLDHCTECVQDLNRISNFNLSNTNLYRLKQFLVEKSQHNDSIECINAKADIMAFVMLAFHQSEEENIKHLCVCSKCRSAIEQYRESIRNELLIEFKKGPCVLTQKLSYDNIFDYVIPYGLNLNQYKASEFHKSRVSHIRRCPFCLGKIQEFHHAISDITERSDSKTVTKYSLEEQKQSLNIENPHDLYADYPVNVEVLEPEEETVPVISSSAINFTAALKNKILSKNYRTAYKTGFAGILIIAVMLTAMFVYSPNVKALNYKELYSTIEKLDNVHISSYREGNEDEPYHEIWVSSAFNMQIIKTNVEVSLLDIKNKSLTKYNPTSALPKSEILSKEQLSDLEKSIKGSSGLVPFNSNSIEAKDAKWTKLSGESNIQTQNIEQEVYELTFTRSDYGDPEYIKFVYTLKAGTDLPEKVEFYRKHSLESDYLRETFRIINYIDNDEFISTKNKYFE